MAADLLEFDHHVCQFLILAFLSSSFMGDGPVLAEDTTEVAVREEDGAGAILAHQGYLFAKMGGSAEDDELHRSPAETFFTLFPVYSATPRTELAILKRGIGLLDPLGQFALFLQLFISGDPRFFLFWYGMEGERRKK
jgi:hypothetical protein